jgi:hypothetical protein
MPTADTFALVGICARALVPAVRLTANATMQTKRGIIIDVSESSPAIPMQKVTNFMNRLPENRLDLRFGFLRSQYRSVGFDTPYSDPKGLEQFLAAMTGLSLGRKSFPAHSGYNMVQSSNGAPLPTFFKVTNATSCFGLLSCWFLPDISGGRHLGVYALVVAGGGLS